MVDPWYVRYADIATILMPIITISGFAFLWKQFVATDRQAKAAEAQTRLLKAQLDLLEREADNTTKRQSVVTPIFDLHIDGYSQNADYTYNYIKTLLTNCSTLTAFKLNLFCSTEKTKNSIFSAELLPPGDVKSFSFSSNSPNVVEAVFEDRSGNRYSQKWRIEKGTTELLSKPTLIIDEIMTTKLLLQQ